LQEKLNLCLSRSIPRINNFYLKRINDNILLSYYFPINYLSDKNELFPPQNLIDYVGGGDEKGFIQIGKEFFQFFTELCGLKQNEKILEVGCRAGRMAWFLVWITKLQKFSRYYYNVQKMIKIKDFLIYTKF